VKTLQCDTCEGVGCDHCYGEGEVETDVTERWVDPVRSMITHDGKYLCGDCVQGTQPGSRILEVGSVFNERTRAYSPVFEEFPSDDS
jgi:hypothetical protein